MNTTLVLLACLLVGDLAETHGLVGARALIVDADGGEHADRVDVIGAALRARGLDVLDAEERRGFDDDVGTDDDGGDREAARAHLLAARTAWRQLDVPLATSEVRLAIDEVLRLARPEDHLELLGDALIFAASLRQNESADDVDARRFFRLAARLEPAREALDPALHPPSRVQAWADARAVNAAADTALVVVRPRSFGDAAVEVVIDGVEARPIDGLLRLPRGPHLLTLRAGDTDARSRIIDVDADGLVVDDVVHRKVDVVARQALLRRLREGNVAAIAGIRAASGADVVIAIDVAAAGTDRRHFGQREGDDAPVEIVADAAAPAAFAAATILALDRTPRVVDDDVEPPPFVLPIWIVPTVVAGGVVVLTGVGITLFQTWPGKQEDPPPRPVTVVCCGQ